MHVPIGRAIAWIAMNDEDALMDIEQVAYQPTVLLVADLFDKQPEDIAERIVKYRKENLSE